MNKWSSLCGRLLVQAKNGRHGSGEGVLAGARLPLGRLLALVGTLAFLVLAPSAFATPSRSYESSFGSFSEPQAVTVDQSTGDVYVVDVAAGTVSRFTAAGAPAEFSATKTNVLSGFVFEYGVTEVAVAPAGSPGGTEGDIYVVSYLTDNVEIFDPNGNHIGALNGSGNPHKKFGEACGVATEASTGAVYVGDFPGYVWRYTPTTGTVSEADYTGGIEASTLVCGVAADAGNVYAGNTYLWGEMYKYQASEFALGEPPFASPVFVAPLASAIATDPANGDVYIDETSKIAVLDSSGAPLYTFGSSADFGSNTVGVGVKAGNGKAYVADNHAGGMQVDMFGPAVNPPVATTDPASAVHHTDVLLNGHLELGADPGITDCHFDWGTTTAYSSGTVPCNEGNTFNAAAAVTGNLDNLAPGVPIHYRLDITGSVSGVITGTDQTVTPPSFPTIHNQVASFGPDGTSATSFFYAYKLGFDQAHQKLYAITEGKALYGFDASAPPAYPPLSGFTPLTLGVSPGGNPGLTVDGATGNVYVAAQGNFETKNGFVLGFSPTGASLGGNFPIDPAVTPGAPPGSPKNLCGAAVDSTGNLWVANGETGRILKYNSAGVFQSSLDVSAHGTPCDLAFDSNDDLYVRQSGVWRYTAASGYTTVTQIAPSGGNAIAFDPSIHHLYVALNSEVDEYDTTGILLGQFAINVHDPDFPDLSASFDGLAVDASNHDVYIGRAETSHILVFGAGFVVRAPTVTPQSPTAITGSTATLRALVDPETFNVADCHFDYGITTSYGQSVPCSSSPGSGSGDVPVSANLSGLDAGTTYHFRIVAANANQNGMTTGADQTLTTAGPQVANTNATQITTTAARLSAQVNPEGKPTTYHFDYGTSTAYGSGTTESASVGNDSVDHPAVKAIAGLTPGTTYHFRIVATNADGVNEGPDTTFTTPTSTGSVGLPDGRVYELVSNPDNGNAEVYEVGGGIEYSTISTRLPFQASFDGNGMAYIESPPIEGGNEEAAEGAGNQYLARRSANGGWVQSDLSPVGFPTSLFQGFSTDLSVGFLDAQEPMASTAPGFGEEFVGKNYDVLYRTNTATGGKYIPYITVKPPFRSPFEFASYNLYHLPGSFTHANRVLAYGGSSADSSHVLFEANDALTPEADGGSAAHYATENNLYESVNGQLRLVNVLPNDSTKANATFGAPAPPPSNNAPANSFSPDFSHVISNDGSRVFWTDLNTGHIYVRENGTITTEVSAGGKYGTATPDGSKVFYTNGDLYEYDVERGHTTDLTPGVTVQGIIGSSENGDYVYYVTAGFDLDVWHSGTTSTIKTLTTRDVNDWQEGDPKRTAEVSPDGHALGFMSTTSGSVFHVEVYDADSGQLYCASCGSGGVTGFVPEAYSDTYLKRWVSTDGGHVFFDSAQALVPQDTNGRLDAYEWERPGSGTCKADTGCIYLLSGGRSDAESYFADASASGDDVFIVTRAKLLSRDDNELYDLYDARVGGVEPVSAPQCTGTGCQGVPGAPPIFATPSSVTFAGVGNFAAATPVVKSKPKTKKKAKKPKPKRKKGHGKAKKGSKASSRRGGNARNHGRSSGKGGRS